VSDIEKQSKDSKAAVDATNTRAREDSAPVLTGRKQTTSLGLLRQEGRETMSSQLCVAEGFKDEKQHAAELAMLGKVDNAVTAMNFASHLQGKQDLTECVQVLHDTSERINRGDLSSCEALLSSQAFALNAMFNELARRAAMNMGTYLETTEVYMRMALRAQNQCRATLETLAAIKNPPVFAKQANVAQNQQVVNGNVTNTARAGETSSPRNELASLEHHEPRTLDAGKTSALGRDGQEAEVVGALDGAPNGRGQGQVSEERGQGKGTRPGRTSRSDAGAQGAAKVAGRAGVTR
jgi:hypothetical protein